MAIIAQERINGVLKIENILAENVETVLSVTNDNGFAKISGSFENGDIIRITEPAEVVGDYQVTTFDGNEDKGFAFLYGFDAENLSGEVKGYKVDMLPACWTNDYSIDLGSWNTEELRTGCGVITLPASFERGEATIQFSENWEIELQLAIKNAFQLNAPSVAVSFIPVGYDGQNKELLGLQETYRALVTAISFDRPIDGYSTGSLTLKIQSEIITARIA